MQGSSKFWLITGAVLLLLAAILRWVPPIAAEYALKNALENEGFTEISLTGLDIDVYSASMQIDQLQAQRGDAPPVSLKHFSLGLEYTPFAESRISITDITMRGLELDAHQDSDGNISINTWSIPKPGNTATGSADDKPASSPWLFGANTLHILDTNLRWRDGDMDLRFAIDELHVGNMRGWTPETPTPIRLKAKLNDAAIAMQGTATPLATTPSAKLDISLDGLDLTAFDKLAKDAGIKLNSANLSVKGNADFVMATPLPNVTWNGQVTLADLDMQQPDNTIDLSIDSISWQAMLQLDDALIHDGRLDLSNLTASTPEAPALFLSSLSLAGKETIRGGNLVEDLTAMTAILDADINLTMAGLDVTLAGGEIVAAKSVEYGVTMQGPLQPRPEAPQILTVKERLNELTAQLPSQELTLSLGQMDMTIGKIEITEGLAVSDLGLALKTVAVTDQRHKRRVVQVATLSLADMDYGKNGDIALSGLKVSDLALLPGDRPMVGIGQVALSSLFIGKDTSAIDIGDNVITNWNAAITRDKDGNMPAIAVLQDVAARFSPADGEQKEMPDSNRAESPAPALALTFGSFTLEGENSIAFRDESVTPYVDISIDKILAGLGKGKDLITPRNVYLKARPGRGGSIDLSGQASPLDPLSSMTLSGAIKTIDLYRASPYVVQALGRNIKEGLLSDTIQLSITDRQLDMSNALFIERLEFESLDASQKEAAAGAMNLPLDLAVSVLSDSKGNIELSLPVKGDLTNPEFDFSDAINAALGKALTGAAAATLTAFFPPTALLALGGAIVMNVDANGSVTLPAVPFDPGSAAMTPTAMQVVESLDSMLNNKEGLRLQFCPLSVGVDEAHMLTILQTQENQRAEQAAQATRQQLTEEGAAEEAIAAVKAEPITITLDPQQLADLAQNRADAFYDALTANDTRHQDRLIGCRPVVDTADKGQGRIDLSL